MTTKLIPTCNVPALKAAFEKLIKKAQKLGVEPPSIQILGEEFVEVPSSSGTKTMQSFTKIQYQGTAPKLNGWSFVGLIQNVDGAAIVKSVPGNEVPEHFRYSSPEQCDHCNIDRRRNNTYVVKSGTEYKQVGKSCLKDFLGHAAPEQIASYATQMVEFDDSEFASTSSFKPYFTIEEIVKVAHAAINQFGFVRSSEASSTRGYVVEHFYDPKSFVRTTEQDVEAVPSIIDYMQNMGSSTEFAHNVSTISKNPYISIDMIGYVVAGVNSAMNAKKKADTENAINFTKFSDTPIGVANTKVEVTAKVIAAHTYSRPVYHYYDSGVSQVLTMRTDDNQLIKMFSSNMDIKVGDTVSIKGKLSDSEVETFEKSPFKGALINRFMPRTKITVM